MMHLSLSKTYNGYSFCLEISEHVLHVGLDPFNWTVCYKCKKLNILAVLIVLFYRFNRYIVFHLQVKLIFLFQTQCAVCVSQVSAAGRLTSLPWTHQYTQLVTNTHTRLCSSTDTCKAYIIVNNKINNYKYMYIIYIYIQSVLF